MIVASAYQQTVWRAYSIKSSIKKESGGFRVEHGTQNGLPCPH